VRLLNYNIHKGIGGSNCRYRIEHRVSAVSIDRCLQPVRPHAKIELWVDDPPRSSLTPQTAKSGGAMSVQKAFLIIIGSATAFTLVGTAVGLFLASVTPSFLRAVVGSGVSPPVDPLEIGIGLGLTVGGLAGIGVGAVVVLSVAWCASREHRFGTGTTLEPFRPNSSAALSETTNPVTATDFFRR
jgi:hypothetical protein